MNFNYLILDVYSSLEDNVVFFFPYISINVPKNPMLGLPLRLHLWEKKKKKKALWKEGKEEEKFISYDDLNSSKVFSVFAFWFFFLASVLLLWSFKDIPIIARGSQPYSPHITVVRIKTVRLRKQSQCYQYFDCVILPHHS